MFIYENRISCRTTSNNDTDFGERETMGKEKRHQTKEETGKAKSSTGDIKSQAIIGNDSGK